ncbi:hypothetical protein BDZ89DRAFT_930525, partial [Hymenopellis radicata]
DGKPLKTFEYYPYPVWLARLASLPEVAAWTQQFYLAATKEEPEEKRDFADGSFVRKFQCALKKLFIRERGREDRFLHSMNVDFFNIEGNRIRGPVRSMGVISVLTYNIPGSHRDDPAYIYIPGLIPGITEPRAVLAHIRHYLVPFLEDLKIAYIRGIHISPLPSAAEG